jgi:hypothetical protein
MGTAKIPEKMNLNGLDLKAGACRTTTLNYSTGSPVVLLTGQKVTCVKVKRVTKTSAPFLDSVQPLCLVNVQKLMATSLEESKKPGQLKNIRYQRIHILFTPQMSILKISRNKIEIH